MNFFKLWKSGWYEKSAKIEEHLLGLYIEWTKRCLSFDILLQTKPAFKPSNPSCFFNFAEWKSNITFFWLSKKTERCSFWNLHVTVGLSIENNSLSLISSWTSAISSSNSPPLLVILLDFFSFFFLIVGKEVVICIFSRFGSLVTWLLRTIEENFHPSSTNKVWALAPNRFVFGQILLFCCSFSLRIWIAFFLFSSILESCWAVYSWFVCFEVSSNVGCCSSVICFSRWSSSFSLFLFDCFDFFFYFQIIADSSG